MPNTHIFTSCTNNYLPLARVLAQSLKKFHPHFTIHLVLCDQPHESFNIKNEYFDNLITLEALEIPDLQKWLFKHSVVELCTAVKGLALQYIMNHYQCDHVIFFDPDIAIFYPLDELITNFETSNILITPHQLEPEKVSSAIVDNEISFLRHGTFNLGFLGVKNSSEGIKFIDWWANRCLNFCYADTAYGLYTDQRWIDLVPSFFTGVNILKHPGYNVANWNLSNRDVQGDLETKILVNGKPLCFYHFSSSQTIMPEKYNLHNQTTTSLIQWYQQQCEQMGQNELSKLSCVYTYFDNGNVIPDEARKLYREVKELEETYLNPFGNTFYEWYLSHKKYLEQQSPDYLKKKLVDSQQDLATCEELVRAMESSKFWKLRQKWFKLKVKLVSIAQPLKTLILWSKLIPKIPTKFNTYIFHRFKLEITPQYAPRTLEISKFYYEKSTENPANLPKISIVTPSYNQAHFIEDTIKSVLDQNYPNLQYIIQDNNSQDNTSEIVTKYSDGLQFNCETDQGQSNAINKGFSATDGDIMAWLNSDDLLLPGTLYYVAEYFNRHPEVDVIYGHRIIINEHNQETGRWVLPPHDNNILQWADYVPQETLFWRRKLWEQVGGYIDESFKFAMDWDLILRFRNAGAVFHRVPRFLGVFRVHQQQKTQSWNATGQKEMSILRSRCHGSVPSDIEIVKNINSYFVRCLFHYQLHAINKVIGKILLNNYSSN
ncbi:MAG: glycosyltransferase [Xenococcaceae cyanobacterium MO_167.B27]|nr:glycosyltransferase [Xenococcaceae cyanobacterium MO_167.B27]